MLNKNMLLTGDNAEVLRQWKIEGDNLVLISKKKKAHDRDIKFLLNLGEGYIASGSDDNSKNQILKYKECVQYILMREEI